MSANADKHQILIDSVNQSQKDPPIKTGLSKGEKASNFFSMLLRIFYSISILIILVTMLASKDPEKRTIGYLMIAAGASVIIFPWLKKKFFTKTSKN